MAGSEWLGGEGVWGRGREQRPGRGLSPPRSEPRPTDNNVTRRLLPQRNKATSFPWLFSRVLKLHGLASPRRLPGAGLACGAVIKTRSFWP